MNELPWTSKQVFVGLVLQESKQVITLCSVAESVDEAERLAREMYPALKPFVFDITNPGRALETFIQFLSVMDVAEYKRDGAIRAFVNGVNEMIDRIDADIRRDNK